MTQSIRQYKNSDELIKELELEKKLIFPDKESKEIFKSYLVQYGYFSFVKKLSNDLMYSDIENKIYKEEFTSNNLRYLFDIDRNISAIIFKYFRNIEFLLNSSMLKVIARKLNKLAKCPYIGALDSKGIDDLLPKIHEEMPIFKKWSQNTYLNFYEDLFKNFNNVDFDAYKAIEQNKLEENIEIKKLIENGWFKKFIYEKKEFKNKLRKDWEYLDIFSLFQTLSFSQLTRIFSYLSTSLKNEIIKEFVANFQPKSKYAKLKENDFQVLIHIFSDLRNTLMHNGSLIKFDFTIRNDEIKSNIENYFGINILDNTIKLNEAIKMMELIININNKIIGEIFESIDYKFKNRTQRSDKVSKLIFEILEMETKIMFNSLSSLKINI